MRTLQSLLINNNEVTAADKQRLGITQDIIDRIRTGIARSGAIGNNTGYFNTFRARFRTGTPPVEGGLSAAQGAAAWNQLTPVERQRFETTTGLGQQAFIDMLGFRAAGAITTGEGRNAFMTEAIFSDPVLRTWLMGKFQSVDEYNFISRMFLRSNLRTVENDTGLQGQLTNVLPAGSAAWTARQRAIEENLAARVARIHNGGVYRPVPNGPPVRLDCILISMLSRAPARLHWGRNATLMADMSAILSARLRGAANGAVCGVPTT